MLNNRIESIGLGVEDNMCLNGVSANIKYLGMNINKKALQLKRLTELIELRQSGGVAKLGRKVGLRTREVRELLDEMRTMGLDIRFDRNDKSYYYANGKRLLIQLPVSVVEQYVWMS